MECQGSQAACTASSLAQSLLAKISRLKVLTETSIGCIVAVVS